MHPGQQHQPPAAMPQQSHVWQPQHQQHQLRFPQFYSISSPTPGAAGEDHLTDSGEEERITSEDHNIGEEISHTSARHVSAVRRGGTFPRRLRDNHAHTNATASSICGIIFRSPCRAVRYRSPCRAVLHWSPCRAVRHSPPSPLDITRQRWTIDLFNLRASAASRQFRTCPADATAAQICRASTFAGASLGFRLELLLRAIPGSTGAKRASRRVSGSGLTDRRTDGGSVGGSYLPSAFVGQPVGVDQVNDVWIGDSDATTHMTRNADIMYDTRPPSPHRSRIILGDDSIRKVQFVGKLDLVFHSRTDHPVTLHDVSFVPDLGFNLFSFHVV